MRKSTRLGNVQNGLNPECRGWLDNSYNKLNKRIGDCVDCWARKLCSGLCILSNDKASTSDKVNRVCDYTRFLNEFHLKSYASIKKEDASRIFGVSKRTEKVLKKIELLYQIRDLRNKNLKHIRYVTPVSSPINPDV